MFYLAFHSHANSVKKIDGSEKRNRQLASEVVFRIGMFLKSAVMMSVF